MKSNNLIRSLNEKISACPCNITPEQSEAIFCEDHEYVLSAAPGSGKTWTASRRYLWRIANWDHPTGGVALLSFTNVAVNEFSKDIVDLGYCDLLNEPNYIGTIDSFAEKFIISPFGHLITKSMKKPKLFTAPRPCDFENKNLIVYFYDKGKREARHSWEVIALPSKEADKEIQFFIKDKRQGINEITPSCDNPFSALWRMGYYTHEQRILLACCVLNQYPNIAKCLSNRFPEIIIDEAQDTNAWSFDLLDFLRSNGTKITIVGDPNQCIFQFSFADPSLFEKIKNQWELPQKKISKSFRCNDKIAEAVKNIGCGSELVGSGSANNNFCKPFIVKQSDTNFLSEINIFSRLLTKAGIKTDDSIILSRGKTEIEKIKGKQIYERLEGVSKIFAKAAYLRDVDHNFVEAFDLVIKGLRRIVKNQTFWDDFDEKNVDSIIYHKLRLETWKFIKSREMLPSINNSMKDWIFKLKESLGALLLKFDSSDNPKLGNIIRRPKNINDLIYNSPLFEYNNTQYDMTAKTIHQAKGKGIDAVLLIGSLGFFNSLIKAVEQEKACEERCLGYVAMSRARHVLLVCLPQRHYDKYLKTWNDLGFYTLDELKL